MNKLIKKYNKWLLAVFGILLMITFLFQSAMNQFRADPGETVLARLGTREVKAKEFHAADVEYEYLKSCARATILGGFGIESGTHWYLLTREAEAAGLVADAEDGKAWIEQIADNEASMVMQQLQRSITTMEQFQQFQQNSAKIRDEYKAEVKARADKQRDISRYLPEEAYRVWAKFRGVSRLLIANNKAARLSDRAAIVAYKKFRDTVTVDALVVPARRLAKSAATPTEAELAAQFEKYRTTDPASGENGIGYIQPPRVKLEWLTVDKAAIAAAVKVDAVEVAKTHLQDRKAYPGDLAAERPKIEAALRDKLVERVMTESDRIARGAMSFLAGKLPSDGPYRKLPADWQRPELESIAQQVVEGVKSSTGISIPAPAISKRDTWATASDFGSIPGIGRANVSLGNQTQPMSAVALAVKDLNPKSPIGLQLNLPFAAAPAADAAGNKHYFTITAARDTSPADTLDEVRARVEEDARTLKVYDQLASDSESQRVLAVSDGLDAVAKQFQAQLTQAQPDVKDFTFAVQKSTGLSRGSETDTDPVRNATVTEAVFSLANAIDPMTPIAEINPVLRTIAVPLPKQLTVTFIQIAKLEPTTADDVRTLDESLVSALIRKERESLPDGGKPAAELEPYSLTGLKSRLQYKSVKGKDEDEEPKN